MEPCRFLWTTHVGFRKESRGFGSDHCKLSQNRNLQIFRQFNSLKWFLRVKLEKACNLELWKLISNLLWHYQIRHITLRCERESPIFCKLAILYPPPPVPLSLSHMHVSHRGSRCFFIDPVLMSLSLFILLTKVSSPHSRFTYFARSDENVQGWC